MSTQAANNKVMVVLDYDPTYAKVTFSFPAGRPDHAVLEAQAEMVPGVRHASSGRITSPQVLEVTLTDHHAQTREMALRVVRNVAKALGLEITKLRQPTDPPSKTGQQLRRASGSQPASLRLPRR